MGTFRCFLLLSMMIPFLISCSSGGSTGNSNGDSDVTDSTDITESETFPEDDEDATQGLLVASPEEIRFGAVVLGDKSTETLTLTNNGEEALTISVVRTSEATTPEFSVQAIMDGDQAMEVPVVLVPDQRLAVTLQYAPVDAGSDTGTLQIIGDNFQENILEIPLVAVEKGESALDVPPRLEFGYAGNIGEEETRALTIWNLPDDPDTNRTLQVTKLEVTEGTRDFHLDLDSCAASSQHPILIAPGHSHSCTVAFSPREAGELSGVVRIETNASEGEASGDIGLSGRCAPPETVLTLVVDPRGEPVPGAQLHLWGEETVISTTDSRGRAVILPEDGGQIFAADGATSVKGVYSRQYKRVLPEDEVTVFVLDMLPVEASQPVALGQVSASNLDGAMLTFSTNDVQLPNGADTTLFMGEGHPSAAPYDLPEGKELVQMFHFGPDGTTFATPAQLTLPNTLGLAPGERIEFHSFDETTLAWEKAAVLEVSADGTTMETVEGGISHFSVLGSFLPGGSLPEYTVTGLVQDDLEQNLSDIHVFAIGSRGRMLDDDTNSEGRYTISGVRVAYHKLPYLTVAASHSGNFLDDTLTSVMAEVSDDPSQTVQAPVLVLPNDVAKGSVRGVALSPLGSPVENARVTVYPSLGWDLYARTDNQGSFVISAVPAGATRVEIAYDELGLFKEISGEVPENGEWNLGEVILDEVTDTTPPVVLWTMPLDGQENLYDLNELRVVFNETLDPASLQATLKRTMTDQSVIGSVTLENGTAVVFTPDVTFEDGRKYSFTLSAGLADLSGNALETDFVLQFQTVAPNCPDAECKSGIYVWATETCGYNDVEDGTSCRNDHGTCNGEGECICNNAFMTEDCSACRDGYIGFPDCQDNPCEPDPCNDHGTCDLADGSCTCDNEFMTADCGACQDDYEGYPNCERSCIPKTCEDLGYECGIWPNGCGGNTEPCGTCESGFSCHETFGQCNIDCPGGVTARRIDEAYYPGATQTVYVADGYVYANRGRILDIYTDAGVLLQKVNEIHMAWEIKDIFVVDGWAYVALGAKGLAILDISDPSNLGEPVYRSTTGEALRVFVSGNYAYVADNESGLAIIDVSDPSDPSEPAYVEMSGDVMDVFVSGNYAFLANDDFSNYLNFAVIDVSDPLNPGEPIYKETGGGNYSGIFVSGNYAYRTIGVSGLVIIDISDPSNPGDPIYVDTDDNPLSIVVHGSTAYVADRNSGVAMIDVTDPTEPGEPVYWESIDYAADIAISGNTAYVATGNTGLAAVNIAVPSNPGQPVFMDTYGGVPRVFVAHDVVFLAGGTSGLVAVDVTNPAEPGVPVYTDTTGSANSVFVSGHYAYMADNTSGLAIFDIADPTHPQTPVYIATRGNTNDVFVSGDYAYTVGVQISGMGGTWTVIDISDPLNPEVTGYSPPLGEMLGYTDVFIYGNLAYMVAMVLRGLYISDPTNPSTIGIPGIGGSFCDDVFVYENHVYTSHDLGLNVNPGIQIVDITDVDNPGEAVQRDTIEKPYGIFVSGKEAYVANGLSGLSIINVSDPSNPGEPAYFETTGSANEIFVSGNHAWIAEDTNGMETFELRCIGTCDPDPCNDHGTCAIEDGDAACTCYEGFDGDWCDECAEGYESYPDCVANQTTPGFVSITAGTFWLGSPDGDCPAGYPGECIDEPGREPYSPNEELHEVMLTYDFEMQAHEVTQGEWSAAFGNNPSYFGPTGDGADCGDNCPVERVNWVEVLEYANWLSVEHGLTPCYTLTDCTGTLGRGCASDEYYCDTDTYSCTVALNGVEKPQDCEGYRLPTEAEWEYVIRAGNQYTAFYQSDGNDGTITYTGSDPVDPNLDQIGWFYGNNEPYGTKPVGGKEGNAWGLYDMSGNVWEWVWDWYQSDYETDVGTDPVGPSTGSYRVFRGGGWFSNALYCRSALRSYYSPGSRFYYLGFRLVRSLHPDL